jgi:D-alanine-D-alanine ligase
VRVDVKKLGKVAVLMGGDNAERAISLASGRAAFDALQSIGADVHLIDTQQGIIEQCYQQGFDRALLALHGGAGEDGRIQGLLDVIQLPYTGSGTLSSSINMDKVISHAVFKAAHLPVIPEVSIESVSTKDQLIEQFGLPLCVKPINQGSSVGISKVVLREQFDPAFDEAQLFGDRVLVQPWIEGREIAIPVLAGVAYSVVEIITQEEFYTYRAKYDADAGTQFLCPADLSPALTRDVQSIAERAYAAAQCQGLARVDLLLDRDFNPFILELNTIPGLTSHSLCPMSFKAQGFSFVDLLVKMLEETL